jgi:DNA-directed RNA polymerase subunit delta
MSDLKEKAAYLRGLIEGSDFPPDDKQKQVWVGLMDFCSEVANDLNDLGDSQNEFAEYIEAIDEDLSCLEKYFYNDDSDEDADTVFSKNDQEKEPIVEIACPNCKEEISFEDENGNYEVVCPECGKVIWSHFEKEANPVNQTHTT